MKYLLAILIILFSLQLKAQVPAIPEDLKPLITGKTKFREIKQTVNNFYEQKYLALPREDSISKKSILRTLKKWNRFFWISEYYTKSDGEVGNEHEIDKNGLAAREMMEHQQNQAARSQNINWILQGPNTSNHGVGRIDRIAFHPTNPNIIFAGSPHGGLFKTINGGASWDAFSSFLPSLGIAGIAIHPTNPDIIYVLTGDGDNGGGCFTGDFCLSIGQGISRSLGVYKSTDGGFSWFSTGQISSNNFQGHQLIIDPVNPSVLLAATSIGLYRTTNGGDTWVRTTTMNINIWDVKLKTDDHNIVFIAGTNFFSRSTDNGSSFVNATFPANALNTSNRISIAVTPANSNRVVIVAGKVTANNTFTGIFTSGDAGQNFSLVTQTPNIFGNQSDNPNKGDQSIYDNCIAISPTNQTDIVVGGLCVWRSPNGGANWSQISAFFPSQNPYVHPDVHYVGFSPFGTNSLYCGNDGGIYRQNGTNWDFISYGLSISQFYHFEREDQDGKIWGGAQDNGILKQVGSGSVYEDASFGDGYDEMTDSKYLVANGVSKNSFYSVNESITWKDCTVLPCVFHSITPDTSTHEFFGNLAMSPTNRVKIWAGYRSKVYLSTNNGNYWFGWAIPGNWCISSCRNNDNRLYAAGNYSSSAFNRLDIVSSNFVWSNKITNLTSAGYDDSQKITDIDVHPQNSNEVYITVGGNIANSKVFVSYNGGDNWNNLSFNLPNVPIMCIKMDASRSLYIGTTIGVFILPVNTSIWLPFSNGLPPVPVTEIELWPEPFPVNTPSSVPPSPEVWISTFGRGIWYTQQFNTNCPNDLILTGPLYQPTYKVANNTITSTQNIDGGNPVSVKFNAGFKIKLSPGFRVNYGTSFKTFLTGCGGAVNLNRIQD